MDAWTADCVAYAARPRYALVLSADFGEPPLVAIRGLDEDTIKLEARAYREAGWGTMTVLDGDADFALAGGKIECVHGGTGGRS